MRLPCDFLMLDSQMRSSSCDGKPFWSQHSWPMAGDRWKIREGMDISRRKKKSRDQERCQLWGARWGKVNKPRDWRTEGPRDRGTNGPTDRGTNDLMTDGPTDRGTDSILTDGPRDQQSAQFIYFASQTHCKYVVFLIVNQISHILRLQKYHGILFKFQLWSCWE